MLCHVDRHANSALAEVAINSVKKKIVPKELMTNCVLL